jgi:hypothetical protein
MAVVSTQLVKIDGHSFDPFLSAVAAGLVQDHKIVHKFGRNDSAGTTAEDIWTVGGIYSWSTTPFVIHVASASANDTATTGSGSREIEVQGLDSDFNEISEIIPMNGTTGATGTKSFIRVNRAFSTKCGTYANTVNACQAGLITLRRNTGAGAVEAEFAVNNFGTPYTSVGMGQTEQARYTIPNGYIGQLIDMSITLDSTKPAEIHVFQRRNADVTTGDMGPRRVITTWDSNSTPFKALFHDNLFPSKTDIWGAVKAGQSSTPVGLTFDILIRPDLGQFD